MFTSMWAAPVSAKTFSDTERHWAAELIDKWSEYNLLEGIGNNSFEPDRPMTVGEVSKVISLLMGYSAKVENTFTDVPTGAWYEEYILQMAAAKLLSSSGSVKPEEPITRGEVFTILAKAFEVAPKSGETTFADDAAISAEQKPYIKALQEVGALNGRPINGELVAAASESLTRSELMKMFDKMAGDLLYKAGDYQKDYAGNLVINATDVKLSDSTINGNLFIAEGVGDGDVYLTDVTVKGTIFVKGGGANSFHASNVKANRIVLDRNGLSAKFSGNSFASELEVRQNAAINYDGNKNYLLTDRFIVAQNDGVSQTITLSNVNAGTLENNGEGTTLKGTAKFDKKQGNGKLSKDSSIIIGTPSVSGGSTTPTTPVEKTITILSFNDFHGSLDKSVSSSNPGADRFVGYVNEEVAKAPESTLVLVAGDNYQGSALSNINLGKPVSDMIKSLKLKYSAIGNHEFDWDTDLLKTWAADGGFTFLCANIIETATGKTPDFCEPYAVEVVDGVKIGIIGFITQETPTLVKASNVAGLEFRDPAPIATELAAKLRTEEDCDIVIALTHMGATQTTLNTGTVTGEAARLASNITPGTLDAIISAHSHTKVSGTVNGTPIVQGYYNGRGLGKLQFTLSDGVLQSVTPAYIDVNKDYDKPDADMTALIANYNSVLAPTLNEVVGTGGPFPTKDDLANWAGELVFNYIKRDTGNEYVVIQNDGGWRTGTYGADSPKDNKVTMGYLFTLMPFDNEIVLIDEMSGVDLLEILNQKKADGTSISFTSKPDVNGAKKIGEDWYLSDGVTKIVPEGKYKVSCNDYMLTGGDKYSQFVAYSTDPNSFRFIGTPLRDAMVDQLRYEAAVPKEGDTKELGVFFVSDLHGAFTGTNYATQKTHSGLSRVATVLKSKRAELAAAGKTSLTIDVGDTIQGAGTTGFIGNTEYAFPLLKGFEYLDFDAVVLGNHEFNFGIDNMLLAYNGKYEGANGTITGVKEYNGAKLAGNVFKGSFTGDQYVTGNDPLLPEFKAYEIFDLDGVKVAVIGMTNPGSDTWDAIKMREAGYYTESAIGATKRAIDEIKAGNLADVIVLAAHMSTGDSFARAGSGANSVLADSYIAANVDVFLGGHGHSRQTMTLNGVKYGENAANGGSLGIVGIKVTYEEGKWVVKDKAGSGVTITMQQIGTSGGTAVAEDTAYLAYVKPESDFATAYTNVKIGELTGGDMINASPLGSGMNLAYTEPTKLVDFIHDVQLYYGEAQISIACPFSMSVQHEEGDITRGSLIGIYNYDSNTVYRLEMKGWQVDRFIEYVAKTYYTAPNKDTDLSIRHSSSYMNDSLGGVKYTIDLTQPADSRVNITQVKSLDGSAWETFDPDATYFVAANDYRTSSGILKAGIFTAEELAAPDAPKLVKTDCNRDLPIAPDILSLMVNYITNVCNGTVDATDYDKDWEITPWWDADLRAEGEQLIAEGYITTLPTPSKALTITQVEAGRAAKAAAESSPGIDAVEFVLEPAA